jgi:hypothetical protein
MSEKQPAQGSAAPATTSIGFRNMTPRQKAVFLCKLVLSILSFGFLFPNLMSD